MKKILLTLIAAAMLLTGCKEKESPSSVSLVPQTPLPSVFAVPESSAQPTPTAFNEVQVDVDISEKMYVHWINEIYYNGELYMDKLIRLQGMYTEEYDEEGNTFRFVFRKGPGCCGSDGDMCGFEIIWDGPVPDTDLAWIEVTGRLGTYVAPDGFTYLCLFAETVEQKEAQRGAETVTS